MQTECIFFLDLLICMVILVEPVKVQIMIMYLDYGWPMELLQLENLVEEE